MFEKVVKRVNDEYSLWVGSPTDRVNFLGVDMRANALSLKLNVNAGCLLDEYGIHYESKRCHGGRKIRLTYNQ